MCVDNTLFVWFDLSMRTNRPSRTLHLIDIENLLADPRPGIEAVRLARRSYNAQVGIGEHDLVVVACNHGCALRVGIAYCGARLAVRSGPNGADLALLDVLAEHDVGARFDAVNVGSGDGIFASAVAALRALDVATLVVSRPEALSAALRLAAGGRFLAFAPNGHPTEPASSIDLGLAA